MTNPANAGEHENILRSFKMNKSGSKISQPNQSLQPTSNGVAVVVV